MKLRIALALAAFAAAGGALAQDAAIGVAPPPVPNMTIPELDEYQRADATAASREVHRACAAEMRVLCNGKTGVAADRCLVYHRLNFSAGCRRAITGFEAAAAPIGRDETLVDFRPYSRVQTRSRAPTKGWRPGPSPEPGAGVATGA